MQPEQTGILAYDLVAPRVAPRKNLGHLYSRSRSETAIELSEKGRLRKVSWGACSDGCCEASVVYQLVIPCEELPHCHYCECLDGHYIMLTDEDIKAMKGLLP